MFLAVRSLTPDDACVSTLAGAIRVNVSAVHRLLILWEHAPCTVSEIGKRSLLNSNTLTPLLKRLEQLGYISRPRRADDERVVEIRLSEAGIAVEQRCARIPVRLSRTTTYPAPQAHTLTKQLDELITTLKSVLGGDGHLTATVASDEA